MHEFSLAQEILRIALESAREHNLKTIHEVHLDIGGASGVSVDALQFAWSYLKTTDACTTDAVMAVNQIAALGECQRCGYHGVIPDYVRICPECGAGGLVITQGTEFMVTGITGE